MRNRIILLIIVIINVFLLTGCWNYVEINGQVSVSGIGIDAGQNGKKYHLSAEVITMGENEDAGENTVVIETDADTIFEGIQEFITITNKKLYFGHCKTMVISEAVAKKGIAEILDLTIRDPELRTETNVAIAKGSAAKDIFKTEGITVSVPAYKIYDLIKTSPKIVGGSPISRIYLIYNKIQFEEVCIAVPTVEITTVQEEKMLELSGAAIFNKDKLVGYLDNLQTKNLSFLYNKIEEGGLLTFKADEKSNLFMSFEVFKSKTTRKLQFDEEIPSVNITVNTSVAIGEVQCVADFTKPEEIEKTRALIQKNFAEDLARLIYTAQKEMQCDFLGIGNQMYKNNPKMWDKYKDNWQKTFPKIKIYVECNIKIIGSGINNSSLKKRLSK